MPTYLLGAEPFAFEGNSIGCLLVHGFTGTPFEMRGLGEYLHREFNYTVVAPVLAGHCTRVQDLHRTGWQDWYATVDDAYRELKARTRSVFAIGLSLGGALVLHLAANEPLSGVISVAAPAYFYHPLNKFFKHLPILHRVVPYIKKDPRHDDTQDPRIKENHPAYSHNPTLAARSIILGLLPEMRAELSRINCPTMLLQAHGDRTIPADSMPLIYGSLTARDKSMHWISRGGHLVLEDYGKDEAFRLIADFIPQYAEHSHSLYPERVPSILS